MAKQPTLWVLVADGARARVVVPEAVEGRFRTLLSLGTAAHAHEPPPLRDAGHAANTHGFAADVARRLNDEARKNAFEQLVLCAPGHLVHDVQQLLTKQAAACVVGTVVRDFTKLNDHDLSPHLATWWLAPAEAA